MTTDYAYNTPPIDVLHRGQGNGGREADAGHVQRRGVSVGKIGSHNGKLQSFSRNGAREQAREQLYQDYLVIIPCGR